ncbi:MAG: hypothetical protein K0R62_8064, partial [Nonomuraea muscovyensis]|nr:hypothetical protein [Nonomuraea muscovyensis]
LYRSLVVALRISDAVVPVAAPVGQ